MFQCSIRPVPRGGHWQGEGAIWGVYSAIINLMSVQIVFMIIWARVVTIA